MGRVEKRLALRLISYWKSLKKEDSLPDIRQFNNNAISEIWENCMRIVVTSNSGKRLFKYEYMGPGIVDAYGRDLTGQQVAAGIRSLPGANVIRKLDASIPMHEPVMEQGQMINEDNKMVKYRSCILPFGNNQYEISHAIIGLSWKIF